MKNLTLFFVFIGLLCNCDKDCFENPNLDNPIQVKLPNVYKSSDSYSWDTSYVRNTFVGFIQSPFLPTIVYANIGDLNQLFSLTRYDSTIRDSVSFYWSNVNPPPFSHDNDYPFVPPLVGEKIKLMTFIYNDKLNLKCTQEDAKELEVLVESIYKVEDGEIVGSREIRQKLFLIPSGRYVVFEYPITYEGNGNYESNVKFTSDNLSFETTITTGNFGI